MYQMKIFFVQYISIAVMMISLSACSNADDENVPAPVPASAKGTFVDTRDGQTYGWVRYGQLEWMSENFRYNLADGVNSSIYLDADEHDSNPTSTRNLARYGRLYTLQGALDACPAGWRLPSDGDWQQLEQVLGMSATDAQCEEWRGNIAQNMLSTKNRQSDLGLLLGGYYFADINASRSGWRFMGSYSYYWTSTADSSKDGQYYFVRKLFYNRNDVCRMSMEPAIYQLSVRYVRDAQ